jgi:gamma-glutamylaminecyclotransferase
LLNSNPGSGLGSIMARMPLIFVYGTLMRGEANAARMEKAAFLGVAQTAPRYTLVDLGPYPGLIDDGSDGVTGELYEVSDAHRSRLDAFEAPAAYYRASIRMADGREAEAYFLPRDQAGSAVRIPSGDFRKHGRR